MSPTKSAHQTYGGCCYYDNKHPIGWYVTTNYGTGTELLPNYTPRGQEPEDKLTEEEENKSKEEDEEEEPTWGYQLSENYTDHVLYKRWITTKTEETNLLAIVK